MRQTYQRLAGREINHVRRDVQILEVTASKLEQFYRELQKGGSEAAADRRLLPAELDVAGFVAVVQGADGVSAAEAGAVRRADAGAPAGGLAADVVVRLHGRPAAAALRRRVRDSGRLVRWVGATPAGGGDDAVRLQIFALPEEPKEPRPAYWNSQRGSTWSRAFGFWVPRTARVLEALEQRKANLATCADRVFEMARVQRDRKRRAEAIAALRGAGDTT